MLQHLRKYLITIYTITAGAILTVVFVILAVFSSYQSTRSQNEMFTNHIYTLQSKLQNDSIISDNWLSNMELKNNLIIHILNNGNTIFFQGAWVPKTNRDILAQRLSQRAEEDGVSIYSHPVSSEIIQSGIYKIKGDSHDQYYGTVIVIAKKGGYCTLLLLQSIDESINDILRQRLVYIALDICCILALFLLIRKLVDRSLQPVRENQERQTQFIAAASHELKSPLAVIRANNSLTKESKKEQNDSDRIIESECNRMARLINDLLLLASGDANSWTLQKDTVNLDTLLLDAYESLSARAKEKKIKIVLNLPEESLPSVNGDYDRLLQVITVLLDNAICYSPEELNVELSAKIEKKYVSLLIIDHGIGIANEDKENVFDRFYRVDKSRKDKSHFGLGLSIAKELITLHHGTIKIIDTPGGGATFVIRLPYIK